MSYTQPVLTKEQISSISDYINNYRSKHQSPAITYDPNIGSFSQQWTYYMAYHNLFQHSGTASYGENISFLQGYGTDVLQLIKKSIDSWYNEVSAYDYNNPGFSTATGHFTCLVWKSSTSFGIGITINDKTNEAYISLNTFPPGNYSGQFKQNVLPPLSVTPVPQVPVNPVPVTPIPVNPVPVNPIPVPVTPIPVPVNPIPVTPVPVKPVPVNPIPVTPVPVKPPPAPMQTTRSKVNAELYRIMRANNLNYPKENIIALLKTVLNEIANDPNF